MRRVLSSWFLLLATLAAADLRADQVVVLRSGAELVGQVSSEGDDVVVRIGAGTLRVPLAEVARIAEEGHDGGDDADRAQRLLIRWLETQAAKEDTAAEPGFLEEAYRLAPNDARIAYWYAKSLVGAGQGRLAKGVLDDHYAAVEEQYPSQAPDLRRRIAKRCELEQRPRPFVKRYDQLNAQLASGAALPGDEVLLAAAFRLVDQKGDAVPEQSLTLSSSDTKLEVFADGWFLCSYMARRSSRRETVELRLTDPAYDAKEYKFSGGEDHVRDLGELRAERRGDKDLVKTAFQVLSVEGDPVESARIFIRPSQSAGTEAQTVQLVTTSDGAAAADLFPGVYVVNVYRDGYVPDPQTLRVKPGHSQPIEVRLQPAINGSVRVVWRIIDPAHKEADGKEGDGDDQVMNLPFINGQLAHMGFPSTWLNVRQTKEGLFFFVADQRMMYRPPTMQAGAPDESWTRIAKKKEFDEVELVDLTSLKESGEKPQPASVEPGRTVPPNLNVTPLVLQPGAIYCGQTPIMVPGAGPPRVQTLRYKLIFEATGGEKRPKSEDEKTGGPDEESADN